MPEMNMMTLSRIENRSNEPIAKSDGDDSSGSPASPENYQSVNLETLNSLADAQLEGLPDIIVELIDLYLDDAPRRIVAMNEAFSRDDMKGLKQSAHSLRGSSGTLGAMEYFPSARKWNQSRLVRLMIR